MIYLQINLNVAAKDRPAAAGVYTRYREPFLKSVAGARSKELLIRDEDVQVIHTFDSADQANAYLGSQLFATDIVTELKPLLQSPPDIRIYTAA